MHLFHDFLPDNVKLLEQAQVETASVEVEREVALVAPDV